MNRPLSTVLLWMVVTVVSGVTVERPKIVATSPAFWAVDVNPAIQRSITLKFDQRMRFDSWSWFGDGALSPESFGQPNVSEDQLTITLPVTLRPGKVYAFCLNEFAGPGLGFQNVRGLPLDRHYLVFQTTGAPTPDDAPPRVLKTTPLNGAAALDPTRINAISITFDRPMNTKKHGLHLFENGALVDLTRHQFSYSTDGRTFTIPYQFKPSASYKLEMNNLHDIGFSSAKRVPLWPVQISFVTGQPR